MEATKTGYNPYIINCFIKELEKAFGHIALFFYDKYSGDKIGIVWYPSVTEEHKYKTGGLFSSMPVEDSTKVISLNY